MKSATTKPSPPGRFLPLSDSHAFSHHWEGRAFQDSSRQRRLSCPSLPVAASRRQSQGWNAPATPFPSTPVRLRTPEAHAFWHAAANIHQLGFSVRGIVISQSGARLREGRFFSAAPKRQRLSICRLREVSSPATPQAFSTSACSFSFSFCLFPPRMPGLTPPACLPAHFLPYTEGALLPGRSLRERGREREIEVRDSLVTGLSSHFLTAACHHFFLPAGKS